MTKEQFVEIQKKIHVSLQALNPQKKTEEQLLIEQKAAQFAIEIARRGVLRYSREKHVQNTVTSVAATVNNTLEAMEQVCVDERDHELFEDCVDGTVKLEDRLDVAHYEGDDEAFRALFRSCVERLVGVIEAWKEKSDNKERAEIYVKIYKLLDRKIKILTNNKKSFFEIFANEFEPAMDGIQPPFDIWRKINLCAVSGLWKLLTMEAIHELTELALVDQCKKYNVRGVLQNGEIKFN